MLSWGQSIVNKYKAAEEIVSRALDKIIELCDVGSNIAQLCAFGDQYMLEQVILRVVQDHGRSH